MTYVPHTRGHTQSRTRSGTKKMVRARLPLASSGYLQASKLFRGRTPVRAPRAAGAQVATAGRAAACSGEGTPPAALVPAAAASSCRVDCSLSPAAESRRGWSAARPWGAAAPGKGSPCRKSCSIEAMPLRKCATSETRLCCSETSLSTRAQRAGSLADAAPSLLFSLPCPHLMAPVSRPSYA